MNKPCGHDWFNLFPHLKGDGIHCCRICGCLKFNTHLYVGDGRSLAKTHYFEPSRTEIH